MRYLIALGAVLGFTVNGLAQTRPAPATTRPAAPAVLPGRGLAEHDFFYAGEAKQRRMFIVRHGRVDWTYDDPTGRGEISDAVRLSNGNVLFAHQFAVQLIAPDRTVVWQYQVPAGSEVHTAVPIGLRHVLFVQNGDPAFVRVVDVVTGQTVKQFNVPVKNPKQVHGQFRHARLTPAGTLLLAHMDLGRVVEYDADGKVLRSIDAPRVWGATPLPNGNVLIVAAAGVSEVDPQGKTVWGLSRADVPEYRLANLQLAWRLPNGNTLFNCWVNQWNGKIDPATAPVQALEVTPDKQVAWALRAWSDPDLGPATTIQVLDPADAPEAVSFGDIR
jgi:hypothetical protein